VGAELREVNSLVRKHFRVNAAKLKEAQSLLGASSESETVRRAIDLAIDSQSIFAIDEDERNRIVANAHREFVTSGIVIRDVLES
jgi:hypothetical protein